MNIEDAEELADATPSGLISLNDQIRNTNANGPKLYDHAMLDTMVTAEADIDYGFKILNLIEVMEGL